LYVFNPETNKVTDTIYLDYGSFAQTADCFCRPFNSNFTKNLRMSWVHRKLQ